MNSIIAYIPNVFVAIIVLFLGTLLATFIADIVRGATSSANVGNPSVFAGIARWAIIGFAALIALEQLQIAPALMNILFTAIIGAAAIAFGLAFGLGGQETARRLLARSENTVTDAASKIQAQQAQQNMYQANQVQMQSQTSGQPQQLNPAYQQPTYTQPTVPQQGYQQPFDDRTMPNQQPYTGPTR